MNGREIEFLAWEKEMREMIPVSSIDFESKMINKEGAWRMFSEIELLQFTGLNDKNGTKIYEGDIVSSVLVSRSFPEGRERKTEIKWRDDMVQDDSWGIGAAGFSFPIGSDWEVIGNIYENPELLNNPGTRK